MEVSLPLPRSSFVGRTDELDTVTGALRTHRLVTITGVGGAGKTRLALEVASRLTQGGSTSLAVVDLTPLETDEAIVATATLAVGGSATRRTVPDPADELAEVIGRRELLLFLDGCEHVLVGAARLVDRLLDRCPRLGVLCTSREPLHLPGERVVTLEPLPVEPCSIERPSAAVALFLDRVADAGVRPLLDADTLEDILAVCRQVDGIALGLEIAAARIVHLSPREIAARLERQPAAMRSRDLTTAARHRTLTAALDWSFELLDGREQEVFTRMAVFPAGADLEGIGAVVSESAPQRDELLELVSGLVDKSLLRADPSGRSTRYRALEAVRRYALARLVEAGCEVDTRCRHAAWVLARAEDLGGSPDDEAALEHIDDLAVALQWATQTSRPEVAVPLAATTWRWWERTGRQTQGRSLVEQVLALPGETPAYDRAKVLLAAAGLAFVAGDYVEARRHYEHGIDTLDRLDRTEDAAVARNGLAMALLFQGDVEGARRLAEDALDVLRTGAQDAAQLAFVRSGLGMIAAHGGDPAAAEHHFLAALQDFRQLGRKREAASVLDNLGNLAADAGDPARAHRFYEGALQLQQEIGDDRGAALSLNNLCLAAQQRGNLDRAWEYGEAARARFGASGDRRGEAATVNNLANLAAERGQPERAMELYGTCIPMFRELGDGGRLAIALGNLADLAEAIEERPLAWRCLIDATSLWQRIGDGLRVRDGLLRLRGLAGRWSVADTRGLEAAIDDGPDADVAGALEAARWLVIPPAPPARRPPRGSELTSRETQVVSLVGRGLSNAAIAAELFISERTVESHVSNARTKLGIDSRTRLTRWAIERGLVGIVGPGHDAPS